MKQKRNKQSFSETIILAGLGNPGPAYEETRHNVGFLCVEAVAEKEGLTFKKPFLADYSLAEFYHNQTRVVLLKPLTYMNRSGLILPHILKKYGASPCHLLVAVDNMDLVPGQCRLKLKGSSAGHNGLKSIISLLDSSEFMRLYIGVGRPDGDVSVVDHVLGRPDEDERDDFRQGVENAVAAFYQILEKGARGAMNGINRKQA
ncbi:MAG: aminoacyl-tRNA hydrolase [Spirochaetales bacterium]|nr:aminoacyl-tRNA hydrolase [Spirochaetales bacterium]